MRGFNIYKSSAGSGKTYTLVKEYLKLALKNPSDFKQILAITFTNKATEEMKSRIIKALVELIENKNPALKEILQNELSIDIDISKKAQEVLDRILHDYSSFSISTIDSFFHKIIRAFSKEMQLPLRFDVEMNQSNVITELTDRLLQDIGKNKELTQWLEKLMLFKLNEDKGWKIENDIKFIAQELFKEKFYADSPNSIPITDEFIEQLFKIKHDFENEMKIHGDEAIATIKKQHLSIKDFAYGSSGVANYFNKIRHKNDPENYRPTKRCLEALENPEKWYAKTSVNKELIEQMVTEGVGTDKPLALVLSEVVTHYTNRSEEYHSCLEVLKLIYIYGIINYLKEKLKEYRDEKNLVMMSDTTYLLKQFISGEDTPFVFEKVGNAYKHFLIDEFQDTSNFQWHNLLPLVENSISAGSFTMVVGDAKQSIYRWRGGNMQLLINGVQKDLVHFSELIKEEVLSTNYRSKKNIVEFNNTFFKNAASLIKDNLQIENNDLLDKAYHMDEVRQEIAPKNSQGGYVKISFIDEKNEQAGQDKNQKKKNWKELALDKLLITIQDLEKDNFSLKDIAILVRKNTEGNVIAKFLFENGYTKVISSESLLLWNSPKIQFIINILQYLNNSHNTLAKTNLLYYYAQLNGLEIVNNTLFTDFSSRENQLFYSQLPEKFVKQLSYLGKLPLYELSEQLISIFKLNETPDAYIQRFQDLILEYTAKNKADIRNFISWWEDNKNNDKCSVIVPENENAIRVLSVHKSKGLQFPVVIMPFADWKLAPDARDIIWVSSDKVPFNEHSLLPVKPGKGLTDTYFKEAYLQELVQTYIDNINVLYVAFTRAEERLYTFSPLPAGDKLVNASELIHQTISLDGMVLNNDAMEIGEAFPQSDKVEKESEEIVKLTEYPSHRWQSRLAISSKAAMLWNIVDNEKEENVNYGILIHDVLANIRVAGDMEKSINRMYHEGLINENEKKELRIKVEKILAIPGVINWFSEEWEIKTERELLLPDGQILRPDRVLIKNNQAIIIDYKTGARDQKHEDQVTHYARVLESIGYSPVEKYLLYINELSIQKITNA